MAGSQPYQRHVITESAPNPGTTHLACLCGWEYLGRRGSAARKAEERHVREALEPPRSSWRASWSPGDLFRLD